MLWKNDIEKIEYEKIIFYKSFFFFIFYCLPKVTPFPSAMKQSIKLSLTEKMMSDKGNPKKSVILKNMEEMQLQTKKDCFSKSLNESHITEMSSLILNLWGKWWKKSSSNILYLI